MKSNDPQAALRKNNLPKAEKVRDAKVEKGAAVRAAEKQNTSDQGGPKKRNVIPNKSDESLIVTSVAKIKD